MKNKSFYFTTAYYRNSIDVFLSRPSLYVFLFLMLFPLLGAAQVSINTTDIDSSAMFQVESSNSDKGILFPRLTIAQRDAMKGAADLEGEIMTPGLTIYCTDCCKNGTGAMYYFNSVEWKSFDSECEDLFVCLDAETTISATFNLVPASIPLFIDGNTVLAEQDPTDLAILELEKRTDDRIDIVFPTNLPIGYKIQLYYNNSQDPGNLGIFASPRLGAGIQIGQNANTFTGVLNGAVETNTGNDYMLTITLLSTIDRIRVRSAAANSNAANEYFLEIKIFNNFDVEIPLTCDVFVTPPECLDLVTTISNSDHFENASKPLLIDGDLTFASQTGSEINDLRMHSPTRDIVDFTFPEDLPIGYKIRLYFSDHERPRSGGVFQHGIVAVPSIGGVATGQDVNTLTGLLPGSEITSNTNDHFVTITLSEITDNVQVSSSVFIDGDHVILLEIKLFDSNDIEIPLSCP